MPTSFISNNQHPAITINKTKIKYQLQNPSMNGVPLTKGKFTHSSATHFIISKELIHLAKSTKNNEV